MLNAANYQIKKEKKNNVKKWVFCTHYVDQRTAHQVQAPHQHDIEM